MFDAKYLSHIGPFHVRPLGQGDIPLLLLLIIYHHQQHLRFQVFSRTGQGFFMVAVSAVTFFRKKLRLRIFSLEVHPVPFRERVDP